MDLLTRAEARRVAALAALDPELRAALGQFFTPAPAAALIASLLRLDEITGPVRVLDPGAGSGSLTAAIVARLTSALPDLELHVVAVEADAHAIPFLTETLEDCECVEGVTCELVHGDYITGSAGLDPDPRLLGPFDLVIMNPPYGKLAAAAGYRRVVAATIVDPPNLYAAFWALGVAAARPGGQVVAIVPRSWANGTYFQGFRRWLLDRLRLDTLHVFESRKTVFADTGVLQENVIVAGTVGGRQELVTLSASVDHTDHVTTRQVPFSAVVQPGDPYRFVRFTDGDLQIPPSAVHTIESLGLTVSTGRVVDFRARDWLSDDADEVDTVPLVYPGNVRGGVVEWPRAIGKPQAFQVAEEAAQRQLVPEGWYTLIKRFSAKEERRRVVAGVWGGPGPVAFENHLNYIHEGGRGMSADLARGLSVWLNSTAVDTIFRTFSGHTQVNAGDLRTLPFPSRAHLERLGRALPGLLPDQRTLDTVVDGVLSEIEAVA